MPLECQRCGRSSYGDGVSEPAPTAPASRRRRTAPPARARGFARIPIAIRVLAVCAVAGAAWWLFAAWQGTRTTLRFVGVDDLTGLELTFFPDRLSFTAPSPPLPLGELVATGAATTVGRDLVPGRAFVRYRGPGIGAGYALVTGGDELPPIQLHAPGAVRGRIGEAVATWCYGWRSLGLAPVVDAEVIVMGGGEHGVVLGSARSDQEGRFVVEGIDTRCGHLGLRVRARGYAIVHQEVPADDSPAIVAVARGATVTGRVETPGGIDPTTLRVFARGLPGVDTRPGADGTFALDHLPARMQPWLLVDGTPGDIAYEPVRSQPGEPLHLVLVRGARVRGRVVARSTLRPLVGAFVYCGDGEAVATDDHGAFALDHLLPGKALIQAQWQGGAAGAKVSWSGSSLVDLAAGDVLDGIVVAVD